jgi:hypothetical protein
MVEDSFEIGKAYKYVPSAAMILITGYDEDKGKYIGTMGGTADWQVTPETYPACVEVPYSEVEWLTPMMIAKVKQKESNA